MSPNTDQENPKFTRGEKCIFFHLIITLTIIIILVIIYVVHVCLVKHTGRDYYSLYRKPPEKDITAIRRTGQDPKDYQSVGLAYVNISPARLICNTLLVGAQWSLAPAQCTAMREDPDMANFITVWRVQYKNGDGKYFESKIKRTVTHPNFNRDDYINNVGLFQHQDPIPMKKYNLPDFEINDVVLEKYTGKMNIFRWERRHLNNSMDAIIKPARPLFKEKCSIFIAPLIDKLRKYEFCATFERTGPTLDHGAIFVMDSKIIGFFSWGDIGGRGVPLIILNASHFKEWFENIISL